MPEPIDELKAMVSGFIAGARSMFKQHNHPELRRAYGGECAAILLREVKSPEQYFFLQNGAQLKSLCDLEAVLPELDEETFAHHVNDERNDFSNWVREVIGDRVLANKLALLDTQEEMSKAVSVRVNWFKRRIG